MNWIETMKQAMATLQNACQSNTEWSACNKCPFDRYCTALMDAELIDPFEGLKFQEEKE